MTPGIPNVPGGAEINKLQKDVEAAGHELDVPEPPAV